MSQATNPKLQNPTNQQAAVLEKWRFVVSIVLIQPLLALLDDQLLPEVGLRQGMLTLTALTLTRAWPVTAFVRLR